jgi:single-strand DNA-binding protein
MSHQFNKITFVGHLGNDPEMRYTPSGKPVTSFNVASNDQFINDKGETVKVTTWFRCTSWNKSAEVHFQYLKKGSKVLVEGKLHPDPKTGRPEIWTRQDGSPATDYNVTVKELYFLDSKNGNGQNEALAPTVEDDIPF